MPKDQLLEVFLNHSFQVISSAYACSLPATVLHVLYLPLPLHVGTVLNVLYLPFPLYVGRFINVAGS
jgi:hypothetical protein